MGISSSSIFGFSIFSLPQELASAKKFYAIFTSVVPTGCATLVSYCIANSSCQMIISNFGRSRYWTGFYTFTLANIAKGKKESLKKLKYKSGCAGRNIEISVVSAVISHFTL